MAYTFKPKQSPTSYSAAVADKALHDLYVKVFAKEPPKGYSIADWKRYVESSDRWDGAETGGIRDVLNANAYALDNLKDDHDGLTARVNDLNERLRVVEEAPAARPFP